MICNEPLGAFDSDRNDRKDAFGRTPFAVGIARQLCQVSRESGIVIGIEGEWGSGKTFLLDLVRSELAKQSPNAIVVTLNPWLISGAESVICSFLTQLAATIGTDGGGATRRGIEVSRKLLGYMSTFARVAQPASLLVDQSGFLAGGLGIAKKSLDTTEAAVAQFGKLLGGVDLNARKQQVVAELKQLDFPVIVIVDDLDRLPPQEIRVMFQAIKAVADFPGITYLVAYDPTIVDEALDKESGRRPRYREKIIQVAYPLPHLHPWDRAEFLRERLDEVIRGCIGALPGFVQRPRYDKAVVIATLLCVHPRDVLRLCNRLRITLITLEENINTADLIVAEALALRFPDLAKAIRDFPDDFLRSRHSLDIIDQDEDYHAGFLRAVERESNSQAVWERHLPADVEDKVVAARACQFLFGTSSDRDAGENRTKSRHIRDPHLLAMYCALAQANGIPSPASIEKQFHDPAKLRASIDEPDFEAWLTWVEKFPPRSLLPEPKATLDVLIEAAWKYHARGQGDSPPIDSLGNIWVELVAEVPDQGFVRELFRRLIATAPLSMSCVPVVLAVRQYGLLASSEQDAVPEGQRFVKNEALVREAIADWRSKVSVGTATGELAKEPLLQRILYFWRQLPGSSYSELWRMVDLVCSTAEGLDLFCQPYRNKGVDQPIYIGNYFDLVWNPEELIQRISDFSLEDCYQQLIDALRTEGVAHRLNELKKLEDAANGNPIP